ncbi:MAG: carbamoyltransferase HypF [Desulfobulbaceae bacterium]|nr:carbamoyltransferase HypF [Desulfobulbaceae bacterium]HIJ79845.1 carbamoyltransferase HypF [Deltaproteobacteria bacterium]
MSAETARWQISVNGIVQGVGFRPFVYRLALAKGLTGFVANNPNGVEIEAQGLLTALHDFLQALKSHAPVMAVVRDISYRAVAERDEVDFLVKESGGAGAVATLISPDVAVCGECLAELRDPEDRRYRYPFINCTNCGPRYTIVEQIPYDRPNTSMGAFPLCGACGCEYDDPANRRFHAQPNACHVCGPQLVLYDYLGKVIAHRDAALVQVVNHLNDGMIVAIKGLGGFHLVVNAHDEAAVARLRQRKGRSEKPLAVMVADLDTARMICELSEEEALALQAPQRPIVLSPKKNKHGLAENVAPGNGLFGLMLPYTPLHHLLFEGGGKALVMTSANFSEEPICIDNDEALHRLEGVADSFLCHDRDIYLRCDDSVVTSLGGVVRSVRRSRGYAPQPIFLKEDGARVLGVGGELKNTVCLLQGKNAFLSQHIGDLQNLAAYRFFEKSVAHLSRIFAIEPELIVHDLHPDYLSRRWAREQPVPTLAVQHHHAHLAACLAENHQDGPVIGLIMDGTGYGPDQTIWGGEVLIGDAAGFERFACFEPLPLPGGDAAVQAPWRTGVSYLQAAFGNELPALPFLAEHDFAPIIEMVTKGVNSPLTSSCGRLFDAVAAIAGGRQLIRYEAQAAIELMQAAGSLAEKGFAFDLISEDDMLKVSVRSIIRDVATAVGKGASLAEVGRRFHRTMVEALTELALAARKEKTLNKVALSGGVFQNSLLFEGLVQSLALKGFDVISHRQTPCNDGSLCLGQAVIGRKKLSGR